MPSDVERYKHIYKELKATYSYSLLRNINSRDPKARYQSR